MSLKEELLAAIEASAAEPPRAVQITGFATKFPLFHVRDLSMEEVDKRNKNPETSQLIKDTPLSSAACMAVCEKDGTLLIDMSNEEEMKRFFKGSWRRIAAKIHAAYDDDKEVAKGN